MEEHQYPGPPAQDGQVFRPGYFPQLLEEDTKPLEQKLELETHDPEELPLGHQYDKAPGEDTQEEHVEEDEE